MGAIRDAANITYRNGPESAPHNPRKGGPEGIRELHGIVEDTVESGDAANSEAILAEEQARQAAVNALGSRVDAVENLVTVGIQQKPTVRLVVTTNVNISNALENGVTLDGVMLVTGDRVVLAGQSTASQNGAYVVPVSGAASRASDADTGPELISGRWFVTEGTHAGEVWGVLNTEAITVGSTAIVLDKVGEGDAALTEVIAGRRGAATIGNRIDAIAGAALGLTIVNEELPVPVGSYPLTRFALSDIVMTHIHAEAIGEVATSVAVMVFVGSEVAYGPVAVEVGTALDVSGLSITIERGDDVVVETFAADARGVWLQIDGVVQ